jgi:urease accessory protein
MFSLYCKDDSPSYLLPRAFAPYFNEPLSQRPAGSSGKNGVCDLSFSFAQGKTRLTHSFVTHPLHLTMPWYLDPTLPGMAVVYLQTPAGGLIQGDRARMQFTFAPQSQVHLTMQAAEKIHSMTANCAVQQLSFSLGAGAYVEYCPEPVILFPGARFAQGIDVTLEPGASFFLSEVFLSRRACDGTSFDALATMFQVRDANKSLFVHDRSLVQTQGRGLAGPGVLGEHHVWGQAFLVGPAIPPDWSQQLHQLLCSEPHVICGATLLPKARGLCVKIVGANAPAIRRVLQLAWDYLRTQLLGVPAPSFPK